MAAQRLCEAYRAIEQMVENGPFFEGLVVVSKRRFLRVCLFSFAAEGKGLMCAPQGETTGLIRYHLSELKKRTCCKGPRKRVKGLVN